MSDQPRPVWLTEDEIKTRWSDATLRERWFAAPADPAETFAEAYHEHVQNGPHSVEDLGQSVLRALGMPRA